MKREKVIECARLGTIIWESECEYQNNNKRCLKCELDIWRESCKGRKAKKRPFYYHVYTKYPPNGEFKDEEDVAKLPGQIIEYNLPYKIAIDLSIEEDDFEQTQNPVYALQGLLLAHGAGLYPPHWVMSWILRAFRAFYESTGKKNLQQLLGFEKGKGQDYAFKEVLIRNRDDILLREVALLRALLDIGKKDACKMVARRLEETPVEEFNTTGISIKKIAWTTLRDKYTENPEYEDESHFMRRRLKWLEKEKKEFLGKYPRDSYRGIKLRLK